MTTRSSTVSRKILGMWPTQWGNSLLTENDMLVRFTSLLQCYVKHCQKYFLAQGCNPILSRFVGYCYRAIGLLGPAMNNHDLLYEPSSKSESRVQTMLPSIYGPALSTLKPTSDGDAVCSTTSSFGNLPGVSAQTAFG